MFIPALTAAFAFDLCPLLFIFVKRQRQKKKTKAKVTVGEGLFIYTQYGVVYLTGVGVFPGVLSISESLT